MSSTSLVRTVIAALAALAMVGAAQASSLKSCAVPPT
jgi:hypothetical protein